MDDEAVRIADEIEKALTQRISAVYGEALKKGHPYEPPFFAENSRYRQR